MGRRSCAMKKKHEARGFTLAEMLTVLAIIVLLSLIAVAGVGPFLRRSTVRFAARQAHAAILHARHYAIANNCLASLVVYDGERFCVVTDAQYVPIDAPTILPDPIRFHVPVTQSDATLATSTKVGDVQAAREAGYPSGVRRMMIVTFKQDGTVAWVTGTVGTRTTGGAIRDISSIGALLINVGGGELGTIDEDIGPDDVRIVLRGSYAIERYGGYVFIDSELIHYDDVFYDATSSKPVNVLQVTAGTGRGVYSPRRGHRAGSKVYGGGHTLIIFPLTGGVVQFW